MTNHYHLIVRTPGPTISAGMHRLNGEYARWFNRRHGHEGHLFQDRFHSEVIETDRHLLEASRYVVLNPVRAGIVPTPALWIWSSYLPTLGIRPSHEGPATDDLLEYFSERDLSAARRTYQSFVDDGQNGHVRLGPGLVPGTRTWPG